MKTFFYPNNIVVIGVSDKPTNMGKVIVQNLITKGFSGQVHAVGPNGGTVFGRPIRKCIRDIKFPLDLAVILTPAETIPAQMHECGKAGIRRIVIESAGFSEFSSVKYELEQELLAVAKKFGIRFIGPNCIGMFNTENGLSTSFGLIKTPFKKGNVSIISQSGGVAVSYMDLLNFDAVCFNKVTSIGNKLDVDESDLLDYLVNEDQKTEIICMYLEGIKDGRRLMQIARNSHIPIIAYKSGVNRAGVTAAASHTAAIATEDTVVSAAFRQAGIIRVRTATAMIDLVKIFKLSPMKGRNLSIVSRSGGHAVIAADTAEYFGFELPPFSPKELKKVKKYVRGGVINLRNPLDLGDLFELPVYEKITRGVLSNDNIHGMVLVHTYGEAERKTSRHFLEVVKNLSEKFQKPVALCLMIDDKEACYLKQNLGFPFFKSPEEGTYALNASYNNYLYRNKRKVEISVMGPDRSLPALKILNKGKEEKRNPSQAECLNILKLYDIPVPEFCEARTATEASAAASQLGMPVVMKIDVPSIVHKTDVGGVAVNLSSPAAVVSAFEQMHERLAKKLTQQEQFKTLIMKQVKGEGEEVIFGVKRDHTFGLTLLFGMGGILAELIGDISLRVIPADRSEIIKMIQEVRGHKVLMGARGRIPKDIDVLVDNLMKLSRLALDFEQIREIDLNPVMSYSSGCFVLDSRIVM